MSIHTIYRDIEAAWLPVLIDRTKTDVYCVGVACPHQSRGGAASPNH